MSAPRVLYIGSATISELAAQGQAEFGGLSLVAADDLLHQDPYAAAVVSVPLTARNANKSCSRCEQLLPLDSYALYDGTLDGRDFLCPACRARATAERAALPADPPPNGGRPNARVAVGPCRCGHEGDLYQLAGRKSSRLVCRACLQAATKPRDPRVCATDGCDEPVYKNARYCPACRGARDKASQSAWARRQRAAAAEGA